MKCHHCQVEIHESWDEYKLFGASYFGREGDRPTNWRGSVMACPACEQAMVKLARRWTEPDGEVWTDEWLAFPRQANRPQATAQVPRDLAADYDEACSILDLSPKSAAALGRRCLQALLRQQGFKDKDLAPAIQALLESKMLPSWLAENVDSIRNVGNFAAHPMKDTNTGAILEVEPHEAEWNLDVLWDLFDFFYVQPAKDAAKRAALNAKLAAAGKPALKMPAAAPAASSSTP